MVVEVESVLLDQLATLLVILVVVGDLLLLENFEEQQTLVEDLVMLFGG